MVLLIAIDKCAGWLFVLICVCLGGLFGGVCLDIVDLRCVVLILLVCLRVLRGFGGFVFCGLALVLRFICRLLVG